MGFSTVGIGVHETPPIISTMLSHVWGFRPRLTAAGRREKAERGETDPRARFTYDEGLTAVKGFLAYAANHTVEDVQAYTAMKIPTPRWIRRVDVGIPQSCIDRAEQTLEAHLREYYGGDEGLKEIGGLAWTRVRGRPLEAEWVEMRRDYLQRAVAKVEAANEQLDAKSRKQAAAQGPRKDGSGAEVEGDRVILYCHGGGGFFSSNETHRYQVQRHARKAGARAFSVAYRLSPQYPFPCAILDYLAGYFYLTDPPADAPHAPIAPSSIIFSGDSFGGNVALAALVILRDQKLPLPAGGALVSPWVDLNHSFPSVVAHPPGEATGDYIPNVGFHFAPSLAFPPNASEEDSVPASIHGKELQLSEQVQLYCSNRLLSHPLVSLVNQGSLGGLPPLYICGGSAELLCDEQIYLAHKAAEPERHPPSARIAEKYPAQAELAKRYPPTKVHLQIYDGAAHVLTTLAWTVAARYLFRSVANFNVWAFHAAAKGAAREARRLERKSSRESLKASPAHGEPLIDDAAVEEAEEDPMDEDEIETDSEHDSIDNEPATPGAPADDGPITVTGREPGFTDSNMIRERVNARGRARPMEDESELAALQVPVDEIGLITEKGPIERWLNKRAESELKWSKQYAKLREIKQADRQAAEQQGYLTRELTGEHDRPPLGSVASWHDPKLARKVGKSVDEAGRKSLSIAMTWWQSMAGGADKKHADDETQADQLEATLEDHGVDSDAQENVADARLSAVVEHIDPSTPDKPLSSPELSRSFGAAAAQAKQ